MSEAVQLPLPGMPLRVIVSALWEAPERPCTVRATIDAPSDEYTSQFVGTDVTERLVLTELADVMCTLVYEIIGRLDELHTASTPD